MVFHSSRRKYSGSLVRGLGITSAVITWGGGLQTGYHAVISSMHLFTISYSPVLGFLDNVAQMSHGTFDIDR